MSKIFEDVYQGIYCEAYELLSEEERTRLLTLALREPRVGFFTDWYLRQLCKNGCRHAPDILVRFGSRLDPDAFCPQDSVECFVMAHETWARIAEEPISYRDADSEDHSVWAITGELIFWLNRNDGGQPERVSFLRNELLRFPKAVPDALQQLGRCHKGMGSSPALSLLLSSHADSIRTALHASLSVVGALTSVFRFPPRQPDLLRFIMSTLGDIGDRGSVSLLLPWTKIGGFGREAIRAIEQIEQRLAT